MILNLEGRILSSLWKWKLLPMAAIAEEFFGCQYSDAAYKRMLRFRRKGFVRRVCLPETERFLWTLTNKGFGVVRAIVPQLREAGFRSEALDHDFLCSALHRGPWLETVPEGFTLISEQELRRFHPEHLVPHIPSSDFHRPDGYTIHEDNDGILLTAIEVELNKKSQADYAKVASFYSPDDVSRVLWLVPNRAMSEWLLERLSEHHPERAGLHQFVIVPDFMTNLWNARVSIGTEAGRCIHELFAQPASHPLLTGERAAMLDLRRRPYSSIIYRGSRNHGFLNRVAMERLTGPVIKEVGIE